MNNPWFLGWKFWSSNVVQYKSIYGTNWWTVADTGEIPPRLQPHKIDQFPWYWLDEDLCIQADNFCLALQGKWKGGKVQDIWGVMEAMHVGLQRKCPKLSKFSWLFYQQCQQIQLPHLLMPSWRHQDYPKTWGHHRSAKLVHYDILSV